jgi:eukaryotic-like serine/threonine-protein kinase
MSEERLGGGRYRVVRRLGSGGMAAVLLAEDERLERLVALKRLHSELDPGLVERFNREARLGASLNHPNVVRVFDVFEEDSVTTLVLEYVDGENLAQALRRGPMAPDQALAVLEPLAEALDHAHSNGVIHRDVKPANVLIAQDGTVKLADLGIAKGRDATRVTSSEAAIGSAPYMAPEQLAGDEVTAAADIYALAALAFEVVSGRRARTGDSPMAILH